MKKKIKKCPVCNSPRITYNEALEMRCKKCGFTNKNDKTIHKPHKL